MKASEEKGGLFISYARQDDEPFCEQLCQDLNVAGFNVWWDRQSMSSRGCTFLREIREAIEQADRVIAVIGPKAIESHYVQLEWEHASLFSKAVVPVLRLGDYELIPDPLSSYHCVDLRASREYITALKELIGILREPLPAFGPVLGAAPVLPPHYYHRRTLATRLRQYILNDLDRRITIVYGMGGIGKSSLAASFALSSETRRNFPDGIVWVHVGINANSLDVMRGVGLALGDSPEHYLELMSSRLRLHDRLAGNSCLIVLDDTWEVGQVTDCRNALGGRGHIVVTSRDGRLASALQGNEICVEPLEANASFGFLDSWFDSPDQVGPEGRAVAKQCGFMPFALALCAAMVRDGVSWADLLDALREADLEFVEHTLPNYEQYPTVAACIKVSVDALNRENEQASIAYRTLAIFHDGAIPEAAILKLWRKTPGLMPREAQKLLTTLDRRSLLRLESRDLTTDQRNCGNRQVVLHDLHRDFLRSTTEDEHELNATLLKGYEEECIDGWPSGPDDGYFLQNLAYHLARAGEATALAELLFDYKWIQRRLKATSTCEVLPDYRLLKQRAAGDLASALRMSAHAVDNDLEQLHGQLLARFAGNEDPLIVSLLQGADRATADGPWLRPLTASLARPEGALRQILRLGSRDEIFLAIDDSGRWLLVSLVHSWGKGGFQLWDLKSGQRVWTCGEERPQESVGMVGYPAACGITSDGSLAVLARVGEPLIVMDLQTGERVRTLSHRFEQNDTLMAASGFAVSIDEERTLRVWDLLNGDRLEIPDEVPRHAKTVSAKGTWIITATDEETAYVWSARDPKHAWRIEVSSMAWRAPASTSEIDISADGEKVVWVEDDGRVNVVRVRDGETLLTAVTSGPDMSKSSRDISFLSGGSKIALLTSDLECIEPAILEVWDVEEQSMVLQTQVHMVIAYGLACSAKGETIAINTYGGDVKHWNVARTLLEETAPGHAGRINCLIGSPDGSKVASAGDDGFVYLWDVPGLQYRGKLTGHRAFVNSLAFSLDGQYLISASSDHTIRVWRIDSLREERVILEHDQPVNGLATHPTTGEILSASSDGRLRYWNLEHGTHVLLPTQGGEVKVPSKIAFSRNGKRFVLAQGFFRQSIGFTSDVQSTSAIVWDDDIADVVAEGRGIDNVWAVAISADGSDAFYSVGHHVIKICVTDSKQLFGVGHVGEVMDMVLIDNRQLAVSVSTNGEILVWQTTDGEMVTAFSIDESLTACTSIADGRTIIVADDIGRLHSFQLDGNTAEPSPTDS